jgi:hypothetical protein
MILETKETFQQTSVAFENHHRSCKPCRLSSPNNPLAYPLHPIFRSRIDVTAWSVFNADLDEALYKGELSCRIPLCMTCAHIFLVMQCSIEPVPTHLFWIIAHYNRVLFNPMLIDAQVYVRGPGMVEGMKVTISFLVARDAAHFHTFPRPVVGRSTGYISRATCISAVDYRVDPKPVVPERVPAQVPAFEPMNVLDPKRVTRCARLFTPGTSRSFFCTQASQAKYYMYQDWVDFFAFKTNQMPSSGPYGSIIPVPAQQMQNLLDLQWRGKHPVCVSVTEATLGVVKMDGMPPQPAYAVGELQMVRMDKPCAQPAYFGASQVVPMSYQSVPIAASAPRMVPLPHQSAAYYPPGAYQSTAPYLPVISAPAVQAVPIPSAEQAMKR